MKDTIIIPTDFSKASKNVVFYGVQLANDINKMLHLIYVIDDLKYHPELQPYRGMNTNLPDKEQIEKETKVLFKELLLEIEKRFETRPKIQVTLKSGVFADVMIELSKMESTYLLLLVGEQEKGLLKKDMKASEGRILNESQSPVCIVPENIKYRQLNKIVYAPQMKKNDIDALRHLASLATIYNAQIFAINENAAEDFEEKIRNIGFEELAKRELKYKLIDFQTIKGGKGYEFVNEFARKIHAELIAIMKEDRPLIEEIIGSNEIKEMILSANLPVVVYHEMG